MIIFLKIAQLNIGWSHSIAGNITYQLNCSVYVATGGHFCATLIKIQIHLIAVYLIEKSNRRLRKDG